MYAQKKVIDNVHIVRERDRQRFRELLAVLGLGLPIGFFLLLFTWQNLQVIRLGHEATQLQQQRKHIEDENKAMHLELDRLTALDAVEKKAATLGFEATDPKSVVMVEKAPPVDGTAGVPPAVPAASGRPDSQPRAGTGGAR